MMSMKLQIATLFLSIKMLISYYPPVGRYPFSIIFEKNLPVLHFGAIDYGDVSFL